MQIVRVGLDLAKYVFEVHGVDARGKVVLRKTLRRSAVSNFFANLPPVPDRHGGFKRRPLLGKGAFRAWPRGAADQPSVRDSVRQI